MVLYLANTQNIATIVFVDKTVPLLPSGDSMKIRLLLSLALLLLCGACTVIKPATATEADPASAYIYHIEAASKGRATRIIWVNPPRNKDLVKKKG